MPIEVNKERCCQNCGHCGIKMTDAAILHCEVTKQEFPIFGDEASNNCCDQWEEEDLPF